MTLPNFPCIAWRSDSGVDAKKLVTNFIEARIDERWMLVASHAVQFEQQLWTAWNCCERNFANGNQLARGRDAEFLRYIAGTHHVSEAFIRAGIQDKMTSGWILYSPEPILEQHPVAAIQPIGCADIDEAEFEANCNQLISHLGLEVSQEKPNFTAEGLNKLGLETTGIEQQHLEQALIWHILSADLSA